MKKRSVNNISKKSVSHNPVQSNKKAVKNTAQNSAGNSINNNQNSVKNDPQNYIKNSAQNSIKNDRKFARNNARKTAQNSALKPINNNKKITKNIPQKITKNSARNSIKNNRKSGENNSRKTVQNSAQKFSQNNNIQKPEIQPRFNRKADKELSRVMNQKTPARKKHGYRGGNYILYYILGAIVVAVVLVILSNTVLFRCTEIEVVGNVRYTPDQIITGSELKTGDNLLHIDTVAAAKKVVDICLFVDEAEVRKSFPTKLIISVKEAEVSFCISENGKNAAISRGGRVIKYLDSADEAIILKGFEPESLELGAWLKSANATKTALPWEILDHIEASKLTGITEIDITDRYSPKVTVDNRILLNLGSTAQLESKFLVAKALIETAIGKNDSVIISLSNPEQPAVRPNTNNSGNSAQNPADDIENSDESGLEEDSEASGG